MPNNLILRTIGRIGNLFRHNNIKTEAVLLSKEIVANSGVVPLAHDVAEVSSKAVKNSNPMLDIVLEMLRKDRVSEKVIQQFLNQERPRMYRFIGGDEFAKLIKGERVTSTRPCHKGVLTDITSNPDYGKIFREGKYRITFKDSEDFAPFSHEQGKSRVSIHAMENEEYYLHRGYSIADVEKIEAYSGGCYRHIYP